MNSLNKQESNFYQRHLMLSGFGIEGQLKLKAASVLLVGVGGLGCPALQYLTAVGVGKIGIIDDDLVDASNLQRQVVFKPEDVGSPKATTAANRMVQYNPNVSFQPYPERLEQEKALEIFSLYDIILDGSDNFETRYLVNDACVILNKPLVFGAIYKFSGQLSVFNFENGPTYRCLFPEPPGVDALPSCADAGVLGVLPGVIGTLQALEAIKLITGIGEVMSGRVLLFDALGQKFNELKLSPVPENQELTAFPGYTFDSCCKKLPHSNPLEINEIESADLVKMMKGNPHLVIIDVRETWERELECIHPSLHIPLGSFYDDSPPRTLPRSLDKEIVIYCKAGIRSHNACKVLSDLGYTKLYNLSGGMMRWHSENMPLALPRGE